jgi:uncharacterized protein
MLKDEVLATLKAHEAELRRQGIAHIALFGSVARGEETPESDIDLMVELDYSKCGGYWGYAGIKMYLETLFNKPVDVANKHKLKQHVRPSAEREAVYAF